jgi:hypothetical protein
VSRMRGVSYFERAARAHPLGAARLAPPRSSGRRWEPRQQIEEPEGESIRRGGRAPAPSPQPPPEGAPVAPAASPGPPSATLEAVWRLDIASDAPTEPGPRVPSARPPDGVTLRPGRSESLGPRSNPKPPPLASYEVRQRFHSEALDSPETPEISPTRDIVPQVQTPTVPRADPAPPLLTRRTNALGPRRKPEEASGLQIEPGARRSHARESVTERAVAAPPSPTPSPSIRIGSIEVVITPPAPTAPPQVNAPVIPHLAPHSPARIGAATRSLSKGFVSPFGFRQE